MLSFYIVKNKVRDRMAGAAKHLGVWPHAGPVIMMVPQLMWVNP